MSEKTATEVTIVSGDVCKKCRTAPLSDLLVGFDKA